MKQAFKMKVNEGMKEEYKKRHGNVFPELEHLFNKAGVNEYTIWYDEETNYLFAYLDVENVEEWDSIPNTEACKKWWKYMVDIMPSNADNSPVSIDLEKVYDYKD